MMNSFKPIRILSLAALLIFAISSAGICQQTKPILDGKTRLKMWDKHKVMKEKSEFKDMHWQFIGPTNTSGRCTDIAAVQPHGDNFTIYVASASGGVWKTVNEGVTWKPVFENEVTTSIGDIAIDQKHPETVWVGTGEANIFRSSHAGCGIYKSTNGGESWKNMGLENTYTIARIVINPKNTDIVYVATGGHEWTNNPDRGVYKTTDGGKTWKKVLYVDEVTAANDLVMDPKDPNTLYASTWQRIRKKWNDPRSEAGYTGSGIWKTTNGGKTWNQINNGLPEARYRGRIGIDIARSNNKVLYAFVDNYEIARTNDNSGSTDAYGRQKSGIIKGATVYRSNDKGKTWKQVSGLAPKMKRYMESHSSTYGWVFAQIRVDPNDENTIYTMGLGLNVSNDGGKTFRGLRGMHGDHHGMWIDPNNSNYLINVNDGGIVVSYDKGETWRRFTDKLPMVQFFNIMYDMDTPFHVFGSIQDHGSRRGTVDLSRGRDNIPALDFESAPGGEGSSHAIDPRDPNIVYSAGFYGSLSRTNIATGERKSILPMQYEDQPPLRGQWVAPFILSEHNPDIIYHGMQYVFRSKDRGDTWERISPDLTYNDPKQLGDIQYQTLFCLSESPLKYGLLYAGTDDGRMHVTKDGGISWTEITDGMAPHRWMSRVVASRFNLSTVYATQNGKRNDDFAAYVWKSDDYGKTWKDISGNIPAGSVNVIREDPKNPGILYVGTDNGVFVTKDGGKKWQVLGDLPSTYVHDLIIHPRDNIIVIATHGRGMWALDANKINARNRRYR
ncbi:MAG: hypothetical protein J7L96_05500 [Bacteroidales bacterium]|nr:hypothetical protein [Bacteroidales bacterium]